MMNERLSERKVFAFAFSMFGASLFYSLVNSYFNFYATDVVKVPAGLLGTVNFIIKLGMVLIVIFLASMVQNGHSEKYGKYRKWIYIATPVFTLTTILTFTPIKGSPLFLVLYYCVMYALASVAHSLAGNAQLALMTEMGKNEEDRRRLSARRSLLQDISKVLFSASFVPLLIKIGGDQTNARGYFIWALIIAVISCTGYLSLLKAAKPYDVYYQEEKKVTAQRHTVGQMLQTITKNKPLIILLLSETFKFTAFMIFIQTFAYYFGYILYDFSSITPIVTCASIVSIISSLCAPAIIKLIGRKACNILTLSLHAGAVIIPRILPPNLLVFAIAFSVTYFAVSLQTCVGVILFADTAKFYEYKENLDVTGFVMGLYTFPIQLGLAISSGAANWALQAIGYVPGADMTVGQSNGLQNIILTLPGILFLISVALTIVYPLSEQRMREINEGLASR